MYFHGAVEKLSRSSRTSFASKLHSLSENEEEVEIGTYDCSGKKEFWLVAQQYIEKANVVILFFDLTDRRSFTSLKRREMNELKKKKEFRRKDKIFAIVGTKLDLIDDVGVEREVSKMEASFLAGKHECLYFESRGDAYSVGDVMEKVVRCIFEANSSSGSNSELSDIN